MNYKEYCESIKNVEIPDTLQFCQAIMWFHEEVLPLGLVSIGKSDLSIIKVPEKEKNRFGRVVPVIAFAKDVFSGNKKITDIILPSGIYRFPQGAFSGCTGLKNITIPKKVKYIREKTFEGCRGLENVYYEGTPDEWRKIKIVHEKHEIEFGDIIPGTPVHSVKAERILFIPGNEALLTTNIHFHCDLKECVNSTFSIKMGGKDITELFRKKFY